MSLQIKYQSHRASVWRTVICPYENNQDSRESIFSSITELSHGRNVTYAAVAPKISLILASVVKLIESAKMKVNTAVNPILSFMSWTMYSTVMLTMSNAQARSVAIALMTANTPSFLYTTEFWRSPSAASSFCQVPLAEYSLIRTFLHGYIFQEPHDTNRLESE